MKKKIEQYLRTRGFSVSTQKTYRWYLNQLTEIDGKDPADMDAVDLADWLDGHTTWGGNMRYLAATTVKGFCRWLFGPDHPCLDLIVKKAKVPPGRSLTDKKVVKLYEMFTITGEGKRILKDRRDLAMLSTFLDAGLRAHEICSLRVDHIFLDDSDYTYLNVQVKGGDWDEKPFSVFTALDLGTWLSVRDQVANPGVDTVFVGVWGNTPGEPMTTDGLRAVVRSWGKKAGIGHISPHDFRRTSSTMAAEDGASDQVLMSQFGWSDNRMPRRYTRRLRKRKFLDYSPVTRVRSR